MHLIGISGSLRSVSYNTALLRAAFEDLPAGVTTEIITLESIPMYDWEYEQAHGYPASVAEVRAKVEAADGVVFATPEYNFSVTGALKNAIDWLSRGRLAPIDYKPAAIIGTGGGSGTLRSQQHLREMLQHNSVRVLAEPQVLVPRARMHFDGLELANDLVRGELRSMIDGLVTLIDRSTSAVPPPEVRGSVLIAAPDALSADALARRVAEDGYRTSTATTVVDAVRWMSTRSVAAAVLDDALDTAERLVITESLAQHHPTAPVVMASDHLGAQLDDALRFQLTVR